MYEYIAGKKLVATTAAADTIPMFCIPREGLWGNQKSGDPEPLVFGRMEIYYHILLFLQPIKNSFR